MILIQTKDGMACLQDHAVLSVKHDKKERAVTVVWSSSEPPTTYPDVISCIYTTEGQKVTVEDIGAEVESLRKDNDEAWERLKWKRKVIEYLAKALNDVSQSLYRISPTAPDNINGKLFNIAYAAATASAWTENPELKCPEK